jgi:hypothetical protein
VHELIDYIDIFNEEAIFLIMTLLHIVKIDNLIKILELIVEGCCCALFMMMIGFRCNFAHLVVIDFGYG